MWSTYHTWKLTSLQWILLGCQQNAPQAPLHHLEFSGLATWEDTPTKMHKHPIAPVELHSDVDDSWSKQTRKASSFSIIAQHLTSYLIPSYISREEGHAKTQRCTWSRAPRLPMCIKNKGKILPGRCAMVQHKTRKLTQWVDFLLARPNPFFWDESRTI